MVSPLPFQNIEDFNLERVIQDSPYAMAIRAYQVSLRRPVFLKLLKPQVNNHKHWVTRFTREAQVSAGLKHPHIVDVYTIGEKEGYTYMAQAWVEGLSVKELLSREKGLPSEIALEIIRQMLLALQFAHQKNIVHRDIKPGNIIVDIHGEAHLTDFGLAHLGEEISVTQPGSILGTPAYMAPEQVTGEEVTPATDLFAIGITLYEMLTGIKPFAGAICRGKLFYMYSKNIKC
jgi:serine/threonine-protein kinase